MQKSNILLFSIILGLVFCLSFNAYAAENMTVDPAWMERALDYNASENPPAPSELVYEFAKAHPSEILPASKGAYTSKDYQPYLNITTINLDEDKEPEHIMFIGQNYANTMFYVIKKIDKEWKIIHNEHLWLHNEAPELHLQNSSLKNRTFYIRYLHVRGSGIWMFTYRFYKVIGGKTYLTLEIPEEMNLRMWPTAINGNIYLRKLEIDSNENGNSIFARYSYEFETGGTLFRDIMHKDPYKMDALPILAEQEDATILFDWDEKRDKFEVSEPYTDAGPDVITPAQFDYFMNGFIETPDEDNSNRFVPAFKKELEELAKSGSDEQRKLSKYLLSHTKTKK